jgi:hypothetical protein
MARRRRVRAPAATRSCMCVLLQITVYPSTVFGINILGEDNRGKNPFMCVLHSSDVPSHHVPGVDRERASRGPPSTRTPPVGEPGLSAS